MKMEAVFLLYLLPEIEKTGSKRNRRGSFFFEMNGFAGKACTSFS